MWIHNLNPTIVHLGPLQIRWYGLVYVFGFLLAAWWLQFAVKKERIQLTMEEVWDLLFYVIVGLLIGSRLLLLFWDPDIYLYHPLELIKIWEGGMSFHGGLLGGIVGGFLYCKKKQKNFWQVADIISVPAMFALALGRIANFINGELVGRVWNGSWCVVFPQYDEQCRHPNMIYSALQRFAVSGWLLWLSLKENNFKPGFIFWNLILFEGIGRILMDLFREDVLYFGFSKGQWLSLVMVIVAVIVFVKYYREDWKKVTNCPIINNHY